MTPPDGPAGALGRKRWLAPGVLGLVIFLIHTLSPSVLIGDSRLSAIAGWQFIGHGNLHLEGYQSVSSLSSHGDVVQYAGHTLPYFPWPTMLFTIPADLVLAALGLDPAALSINNPARTFLVELPTASLIVAITALVLRAIVLGMHRQHTGTALANGVALVFAFTTSAWSVGSRALWQQTVSMLFIALSVLAAQHVLLRYRTGWAVVLGASLGMAAIVRPTNAVFVLVAVLWLAYTRRAALLPTALPLLAILVVFIVFSKSQYGALLPPYYLPGRLNSGPIIPFLEGLGLNLFSPSRGLAIYDPILLVAFFGLYQSVRTRQIHSWQVALWLVVMGQLVVIAKFGSTGGDAYGPRLMLDVVPLLVVLAVPPLAALWRPAKPRRVETLALSLVIVVMGFGLFVNGTGGVLRSARCWNIVPDKIDSNPGRIWSWSDAQFLRPYKQLAHGGTLADVMTPNCSVN